MTSHSRTKTRSRLLREAAVGNIAQWRKPLCSHAAYVAYVNKSLRIVKHFQQLPCDVKKKLALISGIQPTKSFHFQLARQHKISDTSRSRRANGVKKTYINTITAISTHSCLIRVGVYRSLTVFFTVLRRASVA